MRSIVCARCETLLLQTCKGWLPLTPYFFESFVLTVIAHYGVIEKDWGEGVKDTRVRGRGRG